MRYPYLKVLLQKTNFGREDFIEIGQTKAQTYENPVYNQRYQFEVGEDSQYVMIQVIDQQSPNLVLDVRLQLSELIDKMNNTNFEIKETWFKLGQDNGEIRIQFNYLFSKLIMYDN